MSSNTLWVDYTTQKADETLFNRIEQILDDLHALFFRNYDRVIRRIIEGGGGDAANVLSSPSSLFGSPSCAATNGVDMKVSCKIDPRCCYRRSSLAFLLAFLSHLRV